MLDKRHSHFLLEPLHGALLATTNDQIQPPLKAVGCNAELGAGMDGCAALMQTRTRKPTQAQALRDRRPM